MQGVAGPAWSSPSPHSLPILVVLCGRQSLQALTTRQPRTKGFLPPSLYFRSACQHSNTRWRRPLPSRRVRTKCAASAWRLSSRRRQPRSGGSGSFPTATTRIACLASGSGGVPSSLRTQSSSKCSRGLTYRIWEKVWFGICFHPQGSLPLSSTGEWWVLEQGLEQVADPPWAQLPFPLKHGWQFLPGI